MKKATKFVIAAVAVVAVGAAGTVAFTGVGQADQRGWHKPGHGMSMSRERGPRAGYGMRGHSGMHMMGRGMMVDQFFEIADLDGDGTITREELGQAIAARVAEYDADGDGTLGLDEFEGLFLEVVRPMMVRSFQFIDRDGTGSISAGDIERPLGRMFDRLDRAGDGEITRESLARGSGWHGRGHRMGRDGEMRRDRRGGGDWREMRRERREMRRQQWLERQERDAGSDDDS
jgi:Ca2+-binding EF-hand superfamily protein